MPPADDLVVARRDGVEAREVTLKPKTLRPVDTLTVRERMIMTLVAQGLSNAEIATDLKISTQTVKNRLGSIFGKVGVWSRLELAAWLFNHDCESCPFRASSIPQDHEPIPCNPFSSLSGEIS